MHKVAAVMAFRVLFFICSLLLPAAVLAQVTINVPHDQPTIQAGIDAANDGDTVLVSPGTYVENIDFEGKAITVTSSGGAATTTIDGGATGPVVTFGMSETRASVISGMTIQNGGGYGTNTAAAGVAGVVVYGSTPTIQNNIITQNQCWDIEVVDGGPLIEGNTISSTESPAGGCGPGGGAGILIDGNLYRGTSPLDGNGAVVEGNTIENITVPAVSGGGQTFTNLVDEDGGAGISVLDGGPLIENNIIRSNSAPGGNGGGINIAGGSGATIAQNLIYGNSAGCGGGAISFGSFTGGAVNLLVVNNTIADNTGGSANVYMSCGDASQIYGVNFGLSSPSVVFVNNIVSGNTAAAAVGCYILPAQPSEAQQSIFDHNLLYNAGGSVFGTTCVDVSAKYGNMVAAPQFADPTQGDYHLSAGPAGIDTGNNSALADFSQLTDTTLATDLDGNARVQDATGTGFPIIDMGAYERKGTVDGSPTTIFLNSTTYDGTPGNPMKLTASIQSGLGVPTGSITSITFFLDGQQLGVSKINPAGAALLETVVPAVGTHSIYASYQGAGQGAGSIPPARSVIIIVTGEGPPASKTYTTSLELAADINPQMVGLDETITVLGSSNDPDPTFSPSPITLTLNNGPVIASLTANSDGFARLSTKTLPAGDDVITAIYAGDATHEASTASTTAYIVGTRAPVGLTCNPLTIQVGQISVLSASADGGVIFEDDGTILGEVPTSNGTATWNYLGETIGTHNISAHLSTGSVFAMCAAPQFTPPDVIVTGLPSVSVLGVVPITGPFQTSTALTATVSPATPPGLGAPTGSVMFLDGAKVLGTANLAGGVATLTTHEIPAGINPVTCAYSGDSVYLPSNCNTVPVTTSVAQSVLTLSASANDIPALTPVTFTVALSATGQLNPMRLTVLVSVAGQTYPLTLNANGSASVVVSTLLPGTYLVTATFPGNANLLGSSTSLTETAVESNSATVLSASPNPGYAGLPVTLTAIVTAADTLVPTGTAVTFYDGTTVLGTGALDSTRSATFTTSSLAVGTHPLTASYPGAGSFLGSTSAVFDETIIASSFKIALSPSGITVPVDQKATVAVQLSSIGSFAGPLTLSYGTLPMNATASLLPAVVTLTAGGNGSSTLMLSTYTRTTVAKAPGGPRSFEGLSVFAASTLVLLFSGRRRGRGGRTRLFIWLALLACVLQAATGCGNSFYTLPGVAPGSYQIQVTATDVNQRTQTAVLTLDVTPQ